ncbi:MAG TPA: cell division protein SepF [Firmicutes bacterium]|nr:cell division protein SepF [Bacillota bacterium]
MRKGFIDRILDFMGFGEVQEEESEDESEVLYDQRLLETERAATQPRRGRGRGVVALPQPPKAKLVVTEPRAFDDIPGILDHLKKRRPVIISVSELDRDLARRVLDFAGGAAYALDGSMQKVGDGIFLFTPSNFEIGLDLPSKGEVAATSSTIFEGR